MVSKVEGRESKDAVARARERVARSRRIVAFTGAGISTASGVPDFRSPGGVWSRYRPIPIQEFLASEEARREYWRYKRETYEAMARARPNAAHDALARLESEGRLSAVITQNIDGLHQEAGSRNVIELHGTNRRVECLACGRSQPADEVMQASEPVPRCEGCGGFLKPATISFGQSLRAEVLAAAYEQARSADLLLVVGSSLLVYPAASIPEAAADGGVAVVIVNREPTPLDGRAGVVLLGEAEDLLVRVCHLSGSSDSI
jgi:NAD-dependent deacetylase